MSNKKAILNVLCPGDSSSKIIRYFKILGLCEKCNFITFSLSNPDKYNKNKTYEYIKQFIPDDFSSIVILDSIYFGTTIGMILDTMQLMIDSDIKLNTKSNNDMINNIKNELYDELKNNKKTNKMYILNIYEYMDLNLEETLFIAEHDNTRCIIGNPEHDNVTNDSNYDTLYCDYFVYVMVLSSIHNDWYDEYLKYKNHWYNEYLKYKNILMINN